MSPTFRVLVAAVVGLLLPAAMQAAEQDPCDRGLDGKAYIDPKGFFEINPPVGWAMAEFADDPRGKVKFVCRDAPDTMLMIIGQASPVASFDELVLSEQASTERMKAKYGFTATEERITFTGRPALKSRLTFPSGQLQQQHIVFLVGDVRYALTFGARPDTFTRLVNVAERSLGTFKARSKRVDVTDVTEQLVAQKLRTARNELRLGHKDYALALVQEGLQVDPANKELLELKAQLEGR
jgi:hypothetical protein